MTLFLAFPDIYSGCCTVAARRTVPKDNLPSLLQQIVVSKVHVRSPNLHSEHDSGAANARRPASLTLLPSLHLGTTPSVCLANGTLLGSSTPPNAAILGLTAGCTDTDPLRRALSAISQNKMLQADR